MRKPGWSLLSASVLALACSKTPDDADPSAKARSAIINGSVASDALSLELPVVHVKACRDNNGQPECDHSSGMMLRRVRSDTRDVVITARHAVDFFENGSPIAQDQITVSHGNKTVPDRRTAKLLGPPKFYAPGSTSNNDDIAILFLDSELARAQTVLPDLDCDAPEPTELNCESQALHTLLPSGRVKLPSARDTMNQAVFEPRPPGLLVNYLYSLDPARMAYGPNSIQAHLST